MGKQGTIVIDPGHGGAAKTGGSSANNATSPSGVLEKNVTLRMAFLTRDALLAEANAGGHQLKVVLTREDDSNLGLSARANVAKKEKAKLFLSIHCNASDEHNARGVETLIRPANLGNVNHAEDKAFAQKIQNAVLGAIKARDAKTKDRGVKDQELGVLRDEELGPSVAACLVELEFIDRTDVDELLNIGPDSPAVREEIALAIARAMIVAL
jgi:N-acetylmuramoyl-L-alanine amidase